MIQNELAEPHRATGMPAKLDTTFRAVLSRIACPSDETTVPLFRVQAGAPGLDAINADFLLTLTTLQAAILGRVSSASRTLRAAAAGSIANRHAPESLAEGQYALQLSLDSLEKCVPTLLATASLHAQHAVGGAAAKCIGEIGDLIQRRFSPAFLSVASPSEMSADIEALDRTVTALNGHTAALVRAVTESIGALHRSAKAGNHADRIISENPEKGDVK